MKKSYKSPVLHIVLLQHQAQLMVNSSPQGKFSNDAPTNGWDDGGAASRQVGWDDEE